MHDRSRILLSRRTRVSRWLALLALGAVCAGAGEQGAEFDPQLQAPPSLEPFLHQLAPGGDAFPEEKVAEALKARLAELSRGLREGALEPALAALLAPDFEGGSLVPPGE